MKFSHTSHCILALAQLLLAFSRVLLWYRSHCRVMLCAEVYFFPPSLPSIKALLLLIYSMHSHFPLFGNNAIRKGLFYSVTVLPTGPSRPHLTLSKGLRPWAILPAQKCSLSHFLWVFGSGLYCLLESTLSCFLWVFDSGLYCPLESSRKDQLLRPHSCMPTYNLLAPCVMCPLRGGILTLL